MFSNYEFLGSPELQNQTLCFDYGPKLDGESKHLSDHDVFVKEVATTKLVIVKKDTMRGIDELDNHMKDMLIKLSEKV